MLAWFAPLRFIFLLRSLGGGGVDPYRLYPWVSLVLCLTFVRFGQKEVPRKLENRMKERWDTEGPASSAWPQFRQWLHSSATVPICLPQPLL